VATTRIGYKARVRESAAQIAGLFECQIFELPISFQPESGFETMSPPNRMNSAKAVATAMFASIASHFIRTDIAEIAMITPPAAVLDPPGCLLVDFAEQGTNLLLPIDVTIEQPDET
jgi:hypothetical protein